MGSAPTTWIASLMAGVLAGCVASPPAPPPSRPPVAAPEAHEATEEPGCPPLGLTEPLAVAYLAHLEGQVARAATRLGGALCVAALDGPREVERGGARHVLADVTVRDLEHGGEVTLRTYAERGGAVRPTFDDRVFAARLASELALRRLPAWLARHPAWTAFERREVLPGTWLSWVGAPEAVACLEPARGAAACWREAGAVTRLRPDGWRYEDDDTEEAPRGFVSIERAGGATMRWAYRARPALERAHAPNAGVPPVPRRPTWARRPWRGPTEELPPVAWRAPPAAPRPEVGPLVALRARVLAVGDAWSAVIVAGGLHARLCVRASDGWACTAPFEPNPQGMDYVDHGWLDAIRLGPTVFAATRFTHESRDEVPGTEGRGHAVLEVLDVEGGRLARRGAVVVGEATWSTVAGPDGRYRRAPFERVFHGVRREAEGCLRIDAAETFVGEVDPGFVPFGAGAPLNLARAGDAVPFVPEVVPGTRWQRAELEGRWRVTPDGLRRVSDCTDGPSTRLVAPSPPAALDDAPAACMARLVEIVRRRPPVAPVDAAGLPCGAIRRVGEVVERERYRVERGRRVEIVRSLHPTRDARRRTVERERLVVRGDRVVGRELETMQLLDDEPDCASRSRARYSLDRRGRPVRARVDSENCEGVDPGPHGMRWAWTSGDGFESRAAVGSSAGVRTTYLPSHAAAEAEVACGLSCSCQIEVVDGSGRPRERLRSNQLDAPWEYVYDCSDPSWAALDGHEVER